jgi:ATP/maltotriose-dependent transcriptional regulator MalT
LRQAEVDANLRSEVLRAPDARALVSTSETMILDGYWEECRRSAGARLHIPASRVPSARKLAELDWRQGQRMQAWAHVLSVLPAGPDEPPGKRFFPHRQEVQWIAAELALDEGNYPLARRWIEAYERWLAWSGKASGKPTAHLLRARYHARQAELAEALHHAELALELAGEPRQPLALLAAQRALAELESAAGRPQAAETHAQAALALAEACGAPYELALTQVVHAALLLDGGAVEQARAALDAAQPTAARLEAQPLLERINALLEQLTARPAGADQIPGGLSRRELEVLQLAARGLTDAEIAGALFISPRTVGGHLHSIYGKLGVSSRTAATRFAFDHGLS